MQAESDIFPLCRDVSDIIKAWPDPAIKGLQSGIYLAENETPPAQKLGRLQELQPLFERSVKFGKHNPTAHRAAGKYLRLLGEFERAQEHLQEAIRLDPF